ncbi:MAG: hypothetical protein H5T69_08545 [Chloroflexi bacterium]|nr:hypothetical protein [Chloroflexota bacterium]
MIAEALELEVEEYVSRLRHLRDEQGHALVVRNGSAQERTVHLGAGAIKIKAPRVNDRRPEVRFSSRILPPYMRRSPRLAWPWRAQAFSLRMESQLMSIASKNFQTPRNSPPDRSTTFDNISRARALLPFIGFTSQASIAPYYVQDCPPTYAPGLFQKRKIAANDAPSGTVSGSTA